MKAEYPDLLAQADYFCVDHEETTKSWPEHQRWTAVYYVTGDSEGFYVHVDCIQAGGKRDLMFLAKTLNERTAGIEWAGKMVLALSKIMEV
jgi:hypothetical protein